MLPLQPGDPSRIAGFDLLGRIGAGGMGVVYLGRRAIDGAEAAIKLIRDDLSADPRIRARFTREAAAVTRVHSRHVAPVLGAGYDGDRAYLAVEYVQGPSLRDAVRREGPMPVPAVADLAIGLADALVAIHGAGLLHRDLTPGNVLLTHAGPRVIDFGIALAGDAAPLTATGATIGSPGFIPPERLLHGRSLPAGDVFAVGGLLLYAATGRNPFGTGTPMEVNFRAAHHPPDLTGLPQPLLPLVAACLSPDPAGRPDAARLREMATAVRDGRAPVADPAAGLFTAATSPDVPRPVTRPRRRGRTGWIAAVAAVVVLAAAGTAFLVLRPGSSSGSSGAPQAGTYRVGRAIGGPGSNPVTLKDVTVGPGGQVTVNIEYGNTSAVALPLACLPVTDPSRTTLTGPDGTVFHATRSYCSEHPLALLTVPPGGKAESYAVFEHVTGGAGPYTLNWQTGDGFGGTVAGIRL